MKKLILLLLFIVGCEEEETTEPLSMHIDKHGCIDYQACNYDPEATIDNNSCKYDFDCEGVCGGSAIVDYAGNCYHLQDCTMDDSNWYGYGDELTYVNLGYNCTIDVNSTDSEATQNGNCMCQCRYGIYGESGSCNGYLSEWRTTSLGCWWPDQCDSHCNSYCYNLIECPEECLDFP